MSRKVKLSRSECQLQKLYVYANNRKHGAQLWKQKQVSKQSTSVDTPLQADESFG